MSLQRILVLSAILAALAGCASEASYPTLPSLDPLADQTLTPAEQQAKIKELTAAQAAAGTTAQPAAVVKPSKKVP